MGNEGIRGSEREGKGGVGGVRWRRVKGDGGTGEYEGPPSQICAHVCGLLCPVSRRNVWVDAHPPPPVN